MKKNPQNKDNNINEKDTIKEENNNEIKKGFFKKVWYSIDKIEKYSELSAEGFGRAIKYFGILVLIVTVVTALMAIYKTNLKMQSVAQYIDENSPELTYRDGILTIDSQEPIIDDDSTFGKLIIDTNTEDEEKVNQYLNEVQGKYAVIILKDKLILKEIAGQGTTNYNYKDLFGEMGMTEFDKQGLIDYLTSSKIMPIYLNLFLILFLYSFIIQLVNTMFYVIIISIVGYLASILLKLKIRFVAVFNMAIYAMTLPMILYILYIIINSIFNYIIGYFEVMYMLVASIYMIAAIFILKIEFNKKQGEVQKIVEIERKVSEEESKEIEKEDRQENKEVNKKNKDKNKDKEENDNQGGEQPEGSNA